MKRLFVTFFILCSLSGCAMLRNPFLTTPVPAELSQSLAADAIKHLQTQYPPANTTFNIGQSESKTDPFGTALVFQLREKGYAVQTSENTGTGLSLRYSVDKLASSLIAGLYRVQLTVGKTILTRAYTDENNMAIAAGAWAKME